jgi:hypothetical protein
MSPVILDNSCDGEDCGEGEDQRLGYSFFLGFLSFPIGFGM